MWKQSDGVREKKKGNERLLSCWALANKRVLSHYSHTVQYTGQSGDNECGVWCLAFLPSSCTSCLPPLLLFPFSPPLLCCSVFDCIYNSVFTFAGLITFLSASPHGLLLLQIYKQMSFLCSCFFWINWTVIYIHYPWPGLYEWKRKTLLIRYFPLAYTGLTGVDGLIKFCAQQPPLHNRLQQKGL